MPGQNHYEKRWYLKYSILFPQAEFPSSPFVVSDQVPEPVIHGVPALLDAHPELQLGNTMSTLEQLESMRQTTEQHLRPLDVPSPSMEFLGELPMQLHHPHPVAEVSHHGQFIPGIETRRSFSRLQLDEQISRTVYRSY
jgi:hypothetical protein